MALHLSEQTTLEIHAYASEVELDPDALAEEALTAGMHVLRRYKFGQPRSAQANFSDVLALLDRAGNDPLQPGDELPEGYVRMRDEPRS